ncbi:MAG: single-stranded DNA-binding protein [Gloeocapsa sp. UFS-A4-WI-NPMV-4B04]|jgi:single-stranded DNA-binding protein|nr:single-stranded DNA-binding protein [Gloeocapsa sp. UFS-A4-WI-NPMV-4B04]
MNSCILMAEIVEEPQLRYTPDQTALAEMLVQFPGPRAEDAPATLKVVGWGNLAQQIQQQYHQGDRVIIEGRLSMNTIDRPEGFKEKRAELTVQRIHSLADGVSISSSVTATTTDNSNSADMSVSSRTPETANRNVNPAGVSNPPRTPVATTSNVDVADFATAAPLPQSPPRQPATYTTLPTEDQDIDDIPF